MEPLSSLPLRAARSMPAKVPASPPSKKVLNRCFSSTLVCLLGTSSLILTAFGAGHRHPFAGRASVKEQRGRPPARPLGDPRDPIGDDLDGRVRGVLYGDVLHSMDAGPGGALDYVVVDLPYLPEVSYVLLGRTAHRSEEHTSEL